MARRKNDRPSDWATYSDLFDRSLDSIFLIDSRTYQVLDVNLSAEQLLALPTAAIMGHSITDFCYEADCYKSLQKNIRISTRRYHPRLFESRWKRPNGIPFDVEITACGVQLQNHDEVIQLIVRDVTEQKAAKKREDEHLRKIEALSITDGLTQLPNIRHFKEELALEHDRASRYSTPYAILFIDVDHFKHYNDTNGHAAGDETLKRIAILIDDECRTTDLPARYGGEEFVVLCRGVPQSGAIILAERIRRRVEEQDFFNSDRQPLGKVSISIGIAGYPESGESYPAILKKADHYLYCAKEGGRNQIALDTDISKSVKPTTKAA